MKIETLYNFGQIVFHKPGEQPEGIITGIMISPAGKEYCIIYFVTMEDGGVKQAYEFELITTRTFVHESKKED